MRIEVVFHYRQTHLTRGANRLLHFFDFFIASGTPVDRVRKPGDHQIGQHQTGRFDRVHHLLKLAFLPRKAVRTAAQYILDAELFHLAQRDLFETAYSQTQLGRVRTLHLRPIGEGCGRSARQRRGERRRAQGFHGISSRKMYFHTQLRWKLCQM